MDHNIPRHLVFSKQSLLILGLLLIAYLIKDNYSLCMWFGFIIAAYATTANDSIQSIGTFLESNKRKNWVWLWIFLGGIFVLVTLISWSLYQGDVSYQRLYNKDGINKYPLPDHFRYLQLITPIILIILTYFRVPVSTTMLLLSSFSADIDGISAMITKSLSGYIIAFGLSFAIWFYSYPWIKKYFPSRLHSSCWTIAQWLISGALWAAWLMQDAANIAVFLPRRLTFIEVSIYMLVMLTFLGFILRNKGERIQKIVSEKSRISDIRAASLVDITYTGLLFYKLYISNVPLSTTWVFLGLIAGREIAISLKREKRGSKHKKKAFRMIFRDVLLALLGLSISLIVAYLVNNNL